MFLRPYHRCKNGKRHAYWALVESYRTERGSRQRVVAYLGQLDEAQRLGVHEAADATASTVRDISSTTCVPEWAEVDVKRVRVENRRDFGGPWLRLELIEALGLKTFLAQAMPRGDEEIPWSLMALVLVLSRLCNPSSELHIAEHSHARSSALADLLGTFPQKDQ